MSRELNTREEKATRAVGDGKLQVTFSERQKAGVEVIGRSYPLQHPRGTGQPGKEQGESPEGYHTGKRQTLIRT